MQHPVGGATQEGAIAGRPRDRGARRYTRATMRRRILSPVRPLLLLLLGLAPLVGCSDEASAARSAYSPDLASAPRVKAKVVRAGDGDTIDVRIGSRKERVRLLGIDTGELGADDPAVRAWAKAAKAFTERELVGEEVELVSDPTADDRDRYDRLLRYVLVGAEKRNHNESLVREGYACVYRKFDFALKADFLALEKQASARRPTPDPCKGRPRSGGRSR